MEAEVFKGEVQLQRMPGKGGWTYAPLPGVLPSRSNPFGWIRVRGYIDDYEIRHYHAMPMKNGRLFLAVKAEIRKKIKKQVGDTVKVQLFVDDRPVEIPQEFLDCLRDEPLAMKRFMTLSDGVKKQYLESIYSLKRVESRIEKMAKVISELVRAKNAETYKVSKTL